MGFLDKIKGMAKGRGKQIDSGIDSAEKFGKAKAPDQYDAKIDAAAVQARKAATKLND